MGMLNTERVISSYGLSRIHTHVLGFELLEKPANAQYICKTL